MRKRLNLLAILAILMFIFAQSAQAVLYEDISAFDLYEMLSDKEKSGYLVLDIRAADEYDEGHIPGALNIPLRELGYRVYELDDALDIIVYCNLGLQSKVAIQVLVSAGFKDVYNLIDGLNAWDYALETSNGSISI